MRNQLRPVLEEMKSKGFQHLPLDFPGVAEACMLYSIASPKTRAAIVATSLTPEEPCTSVWDDTTMTFRTCLNTQTRSTYMLPSGSVFADIAANIVVVARGDTLYTTPLGELGETCELSVLFEASCYICDFCAHKHTLLFGDYMQAKVWILTPSAQIVALDLDFASYYHFEWIDTDNIPVLLQVGTNKITMQETKTKWVLRLGRLELVNQDDTPTQAT